MLFFVEVSRDKAGIGEDLWKQYTQILPQEVTEVPPLDSVMMNSLVSALQASQLRQQVEANNIANANTPGYKRQTVLFESLLQQNLAQAGWGPGGTTLAMAADNPADLNASSGVGSVAPQVVTDMTTSVSNNGNNVGLDAEMSALAENQIEYGALTQELTDQFTMLKTAITG